jgi:hypothetical protein
MALTGIFGNLLTLTAIPYAAKRKRFSLNFNNIFVTDAPLVATTRFGTWDRVSTLFSIPCINDAQKPCFTCVSLSLLFTHFTAEQ